MAEDAAQTSGDQESTTTEATEQPAAIAERLGDPGKKALDAERSNRKAAEKRLREMESELNKLREATMSETEKAVAQAKSEGRAEALASIGSRLAAAEIRVAAGGRMSDEQLETLLEVTNLAVFIGEDGEVDKAKVLRFVEGIAPTPDPNEQEARHGFPDLGQGARGSSNVALNGDPLLRDLKAKLGIR